MTFMMQNVSNKSEFVRKMYLACCSMFIILIIKEYPRSNLQNLERWNIFTYERILFAFYVAQSKYVIEISLNS